MKQTANLRLVFAALTSAVVLGSGFAADEAKLAAKEIAIDVSRLGPELVGVAKLLQSGVDQQVVITYIANSAPRRSPTAEELVYLRDLGLSTDGMVALLNAAPKVALAQEAVTPPQPVGSRPAQTAPLQPQPVQRETPAASPDLVAASQPPANAVISSQPQVVYTQPAPATVYVQTPPPVAYVPSYPTFSFGLGLGHHVFGHHGGGHYSAHGGGHHGGGGHGGGHH